MTTEAEPPVSVEFRCARCDAVAMRVTTTTSEDTLDAPSHRPAGEPGIVARVTGIRAEAGTLNLWSAVSEIEAGVGSLRAAVLAGDAEALMGMDREIVPFYCRECAASYCKDHWTTWAVYDSDYPGGWFEELRGTCPEGHERRIHD